MNNTRKKSGKLLVAGLMVLGLGLLQKAEAATSDTMNVLVTPGNVVYGVQITSAMNQGYDFGTVNLGLTTGSTKAIGVTNNGTISEYFVMKISTTSGGTVNWVPKGVDTTPGTDEFELQGLLYATSSTQPADGAFAGDANVIGGTAGATGASTYNQGTNKTGGGVTKDLWLKLKMPAGQSASDTAQKTMILTITGQGT